MVITNVIANDSIDIIIHLPIKNNLLQFRQYSVMISDHFSACLHLVVSMRATARNLA